jgi:hypothetical protein
MLNVPPGEAAHFIFGSCTIPKSRSRAFNGAGNRISDPIVRRRHIAMKRDWL